MAAWDSDSKQFRCATRNTSQSSTSASTPTRTSATGKRPKGDFSGTIAAQTSQAGAPPKEKKESAIMNVIEKGDDLTFTVSGCALRGKKRGTTGVFKEATGCLAPSVEMTFEQSQATKTSIGWTLNAKFKFRAAVRGKDLVGLYSMDGTFQDR